jgi:hypothetical protein
VYQDKPTKFRDYQSGPSLLAKERFVPQPKNEMREGIGMQALEYTRGWLRLLSDYRSASI